MKKLFEIIKSIIKKISHLIGKAISLLSAPASIAAAICTIILAVAFLQGINTMDDYKDMKRNGNDVDVAIDIWKKDLEVVRLNYSKDYIENTIGMPPISYTIPYEGIDIENKIYINDYFTLVCCYAEKETLIGFLIIGNNPSFDFKNYRCPFELFKTSINETEDICKENGVYSEAIIRSNDGGRLDNNSFYYECNLQHSRGGGRFVLIGYGICDIGFLINEEDVVNKFHTMQQLDIDFSDKDRTYPNDSIRSELINSFMVFDESFTTYVQKYIITPSYLGITRDDYANSTKNYQKTIERYFNLQE